MRSLGRGDVSRLSPLQIQMAAVEVPETGRGAEDGDLRAAVAVVVAGHGHVAALSPLNLDDRAVAGLGDGPDAGGRTPHRRIDFGVAVVVGGDGRRGTRLSPPRSVD